jgi:hypothetical protein
MSNVIDILVFIALGLGAERLSLHGGSHQSAVRRLILV